MYLFIKKICITIDLKNTTEEVFDVKTMTKKERVIAAIEGRPVDGVPSGFSLHFSMQSTTSKDVADGKTYLSTMQSNLDVLKEALN